MKEPFVEMKSVEMTMNNLWHILLNTHLDLFRGLVGTDGYV